MESIIVSNSSLKGKSFTCLETSVNLIPSDSSLKALASCCLFGKVIAPMVVEEINVTDFVAKTWKIPVSVVALVDNEKTSNIFKFGFECADHRNWAIDNGPWCVRGYSLVLQAWTPTIVGPVTFQLMRVWIQIHNLPHEYFSKENGYLLGGMVGKVIKVELEEANPASWSKFMKVLVDIEFDKPLFSGCFCDLATGVKQWIQVKYERIGIFCYFCGCLGHQQRGCKLSSPVTMSNSDGIPFPMYGPWMSTLSSYSTVFSGPTSTVTRGASLSTLRNKDGPLLTLPATMDADAVPQRSSHALPALRSKRPVKGTARSTAGLETNQRAVWFHKNRVLGDARSVSISGLPDEEHVFPLLSSVGKVVNGPSLSFGPISNNFNNSCGPALVEYLDKSNPTRELLGPALVGNNMANGVGPILSSQGNGGLVESSSPLPIVPLEAVDHFKEEKALAQFFNAQESLLYDLKYFGKLDLYEIQKIGGDIGVPASSEVNERTTPFKKRKFEASASLCSRPHKVQRKYPEVVRDFPWDTTKNANDADLVYDEPFEDRYLCWN
ncbi:hypothetical protein G4B88_010790 [Cannabis sativa]|uniref:Zinc knuckle CX2CX4HX4C domain-containing protein n=1 Tax=Cannabis sativa TaxID=3483 RepID=A0A7J6GF24_CANSA|nr:hypothetical protein G4B88_010790 [Cannabis sativa]